jgi:predicted DNA-binding protein (UPF0251 family)
MGRHCKKKKIDFYPVCKCLVPYWLDFDKVEKVYLTKEECEVIRLKDILNLWVVEWGEIMWISKSTFSQIRRQAHKKVADAIIHWKAIVLGCD